MTRSRCPPNGMQGSIHQFLQPTPTSRCQEQYVPQAAFRTTSICQQVLSAELGWPTPPSYNAWHSVRARQNMAHVWLPPVFDTFSTGQRQPVSVLELQQTSSSCCGTSTLAAAGYDNGMLHIIRVSDLLNTAHAANRACQSAAVHTKSGASDPNLARSARHSGGAAAVPAGSVMTVDLQDRLLSLCWAPAGGEFNEMVTAGTAGVKIRGFAEARHHAYALKPRSGSQLAKPGPVKYLDRSAAYQVVAAKFGGLVLWDCRAASRAVAELATSCQAQLLQVMPGGTVILTGAADGQVALYDVRCVSSTSSSVVNFGGSRAPQQLITSCNVPARASQATTAEADSASTATGRAASELSVSNSNLIGSNSGLQVYPYFADIQLNPMDCNLVAYVRPDLQVGLLDLYNKKVLQQVCMIQTVSPTTGIAAGSATAHITSYPQQAPACGCWDPQGRVLYTHGMMQQYSSTDGAAAGVLHLQPTVAAVDFGSFHKGQLRRQSAGWLQSCHASDMQGAVFGDTAPAEQQHQQDVSSSDGNSADAGAMRHSRQVLHLPLPNQSSPTALAVCNVNGELFSGTLLGDVVCVS